MADRTSKLNLQYIVANQSQKEVTINADLNVLDMLVQATAKGIANAPPASPAEGEMYIIGDAPTGAWEGKAKHLAGFFAGVWLIVAPRAGWRVWLEEGTAMRYQDGRWTDEGAGLDDKAPLASPALTGKPTTPTAAKGTNDAQIASTAFVAQAVATLVNSAPETLDTLQELAKALNNDPNFATTMLNLLAGKVSKSGDTMSGGLTFTTNTVGLCGYVNNDQDYWRLWGRNSHPEVALDLRSYGGRKSSMFFRRFIDNQITEWVYLIDDDGNARFPKDLKAFSIYSNDWFRVNESNRGIYWEKHRGGWYMQDDEWIRVWNGKGVYTSGKIRCDAGFEGSLRGTADNASKLGNMTLAELLAEVDRRIAAKHP